MLTRTCINRCPSRTARRGGYYFECYPHPAIIAGLNLDALLKYKARHRNAEDWSTLLNFLAALPIHGLREVVDALRVQNKQNEDKIDAIVCAYVAEVWWRHGTERSSMLGDMTSGYIVTPHNPATRTRYEQAFSSLNDDSGEVAPRTTEFVRASVSTSNPALSRNASAAAMSQTDWQGEATLIATDPGENIWQRCRGLGIVNGWLTDGGFENRRLVVKLLEEDGEPEVAFVPFRALGNTQRGFKVGGGQRELWRTLVAGASGQNPLPIKAAYRFEPLPMNAAQEAHVGG